jgi:hypothetical protein
MENRAVGCFARIDAKLFEKAPYANPGALVANADADGAILVVHAHGDDRALEPRVADSRHREQQLAGQEARRFHPSRMNPDGGRNKP